MPRNYWKDPQNQRAFLESIAKDLNITKPADWYSVTTAQLKEMGGSTLVNLHGLSILSCNEHYLLLTDQVSIEVCLSRRKLGWSTSKEDS